MAVPGKLRDDLEDTHLVAVVQGGGRLIQDEHGCLLDEGAREQDELALTPGELGEQAVGEPCHPEPVELLERAAPVGGAGGGQRAEMGCAAHDRDAERGERERRRGTLRHVGDQPRELSRREGGDVVAADPDAAPPWPEQAEQAAQQRRLARSVRPQQAADLGFLDGQRHPGEPVTAAWIGEGQVIELDARHGGSGGRLRVRFGDQSHWRPALARSATKNGAPMSAVRMPSGRSSVVAVRATSSTTSR